MQAAATAACQAPNTSSVVVVPVAPTSSPAVSAPTGIMLPESSRAALLTRPRSRSGVRVRRAPTTVAFQAGAGKTAHATITPSSSGACVAASAVIITASTQNAPSTIIGIEKRLVIRGAASAPSRPPAPSSAKMTPIVADDAPCS
jgi:hypothetical protein